MRIGARLGLGALIAAVAALGSGCSGCSDDPPATSCDASSCSSGATCLPAPAAGSILATCEAAHRTCVEATAGQAACGDCAAMFVAVGEACEAATTCASLDCATQHRACSDTPNGHCTTCLTGFVEDGGACRPFRTCADTTCGAGERCVSHAGGDATCEASQCAAGQVPKADGSACITCALDCAGRAGGTGQIWPGAATLAETCVCETRSGWFWDEGATGGGDIRPCDADQDGWVRVTAKKPMESTADRAIHENARCTVLAIDRVVLENDFAETFPVMLAQPISLYEPERNDDQALLDTAVAQGRLSRYGPRGLRAEELNTLTKACAWKASATQRVDFNDNGFEDVDEAHDDPALVDPTNPLSPLWNFAYFVEGYRGWYTPSPTGQGFGAYHVREKSRRASEPDPGLALPLVYTSSAGGTYRESCVRLRDAAYEAGEPGFDFAKHAVTASWRGMGHHSQFRCLRLVESASAKANEVTLDQARTEWVMNQCAPEGTRGPVGSASTGNPSDPAMTCALVADAALPDPRTAATPPVLWGASRYLPYDDDFNTYGRPSYVRGCINECAETPDVCSGYDPDPFVNRAQCVGAPTNFGRLACGCSLQNAGPNCEVGCPGDLSISTSGSLFTTPGFDAVSRTGLWLCARPAASVGSDLAQAGGGFTIRGGVELSAGATGTPLCEHAGPDPSTCAAGLSIRAYAR